MKKIFFGCVFLFFLSLSAFAQEKVITESEFNEIISKANEKIKTVNYRLTKNEELFLKPNGKPASVRLEIRETLLPNKWREVTEEKSKDKNTRTERLWDGNKLYVKENEAEWKKYDGGSGFSGSVKTGQFTKIYKFIEKSKLDENVVNVYDVEIKRVANKFTQTSMYQVTYLEKTRYWISEDNFLLKKKVENTVVGSESVAIENWIYEYNPKDLKIEAPIKEEK